MAFPSMYSSREARLPMEKPVASFARRFGRIAGAALLVFICLLVSVIFTLRFVPPPTSAFMVQRHFQVLLRENHAVSIHYQWVDWKDISPHAALAVVASEDQKFPVHRGFDFQSMRDAWEERHTRGRLRGASTITQQTAKNLFLWETKSYVRKGLEACITVVLEALWPKRRILEVYLNIAEFGDGIYGVHSAAEIFFGKSPSQLTRTEASLLAAVLPHPKRYSAKAPSGYVLHRSEQIQRQMNNLGRSYLKDL